jgi:hypothetical protein
MGSMSSSKKEFSLQRVKNHLANFARGRPILTLLLGLLLVIYSLGFFSSSPSLQDEEMILMQSKDLSLETLKDVAEYLRAGDMSLVKPGPSDKTWERQTSDACGSYLDQAYHILATSKSEHIKTEAVQVITLCTTDRPKNRARLTTVVKDVPAAIVSLLAPSSSYVSKAAAAECIWISSFSSRTNFDALVEAGAVERLSNVIIKDECKKDACFVAKMWAAAALQNLAAAYCDSGRCHWEWTKMKKNKRHEIAITNKKIDYNPESLRVSMIRNDKLIKALTRIICDNVKELDKAPTERTWPSRAKVTDAKLTPSVAAWGAIGAIRNLALSPELYDNMPSDLQTCLCAHVVRSPDWLENSKAEDAIYRFGLDAREVCEPLYDHDKCLDYKDWKDEEGENCQKYERKRWCAEYRDYAPKNDKKYVTAGEACCACGGGKKQP